MGGLQDLSLFPFFGSRIMPLKIEKKLGGIKSGFERGNVNLGLFSGPHLAKNVEIPGPSVYSAKNRVILEWIWTSFYRKTHVCRLLYNGPERYLFI